MQRRRSLGLPCALIALILGACGGRPDAPVQVGFTAAGTAGGSYYLESIRKLPVWVEEMTPTVLTPIDERKPDFCPDLFQVLPSEGTYESRIRPFLDAMGSLDFGAGSAYPDAANDTSASIARAWRDLGVRARGEVSGYGLLRVLIKHYPRPSLPGRCVTVQVDVYTLPDRYLDWRDSMDSAMEDEELAGVLLRLRRTLQTEQEPHRLIEASIELQERFTIGSSGFDYERALAAPAAAQDGERDAHFEDFAPARRWGLKWIDTSAGRGTVDAWARSYVVEGQDAESAPLPAAWIEPLKRFVQQL